MPDHPEVPHHTYSCRRAARDNREEIIPSRVPETCPRAQLSLLATLRVLKLSLRVLIFSPAEPLLQPFLLLTFVLSACRLDRQGEREREREASTCFLPISPTCLLLLSPAALCLGEGGPACSARPSTSWSLAVQAHVLEAGQAGTQSG